MSNETKFTPGNWFAFDNGNGYFLVDADYSTSTLIASTAHNDPNAEANAHLIAAAPDMYEALKRLKKEYEGLSFRHLGNYTSSTNWQISEAALLKAEGKPL